MYDSQPAAFLRYPGRVPLRYQPCRPAALENASSPATPGGICFPCGEFIDIGTPVQVSLAAPHGIEQFTVRVAWCRPEGVEFLAGACLLNEQDACRARMVAQLCHIDLYRHQEQASGRVLDEETAASEWIERYAHQVPQIV